MGLSCALRGPAHAESRILHGTGLREVCRGRPLIMSGVELPNKEQSATDGRSQGITTDQPPVARRGQVIQCMSGRATRVKASVLATSGLAIVHPASVCGTSLAQGHHGFQRAVGLISGQASRRREDRSTISFTFSRGPRRGGLSRVLATRHAVLALQQRRPRTSWRSVFLQWRWQWLKHRAKTRGRPAKSTSSTWAGGADRSPLFLLIGSTHLRRRTGSMSAAAPVH